MERLGSSQNTYKWHKYSKYKKRANSSDYPPYSRPFVVSSPSSHALPLVLVVHAELKCFHHHVGCVLVFGMCRTSDMKRHPIWVHFRARRMQEVPKTRIHPCRVCSLGFFCSSL